MYVHATLLLTPNVDNLREHAKNACRYERYISDILQSDIESRR